MREMEAVTKHINPVRDTQLPSQEASLLECNRTHITQYNPCTKLEGSPWTLTSFINQVVWNVSLS